MSGLIQLIREKFHSPVNSLKEDKLMNGPLTKIDSNAKKIPFNMMADLLSNPETRIQLAAGFSDGRTFSWKDVEGKKIEELADYVIRRHAARENKERFWERIKENAIQKFARKALLSEWDEDRRRFIRAAIDKSGRDLGEPKAATRLISFAEIAFAYGLFNEAIKIYLEAECTAAGKRDYDRSLESAMMVAVLYRIHSKYFDSARQLFNIGNYFYKIGAMKYALDAYYASARTAFKDGKYEDALAYNDQHFKVANEFLNDAGALGLEGVEDRIENGRLVFEAIIPEPPLRQSHIDFALKEVAYQQMTDREKRERVSDLDPIPTGGASTGI